MGLVSEMLHGKTIINILAIMFFLLGITIVIAWKQHILSEADAVYYFSIALTILAIVNFLYAIYSGEISAKGLPVYRNKSPSAYYILLLLNFCIISISLYAACSYGISK